MSKDKVTAQITCSHAECQKQFHIVLDVVSDETEQTTTVVECLHCRQPVKIDLPKKYVPNVMIIRGGKP